MLRVYCPGWRPAKVNRPFPSDTVLRPMGWSSTSAPGNKARSESVTTPLSVPLATPAALRSCAPAMRPNQHIAMASKIAYQYLGEDICWLQKGDCPGKTVKINGGL